MFLTECPRDAMQGWNDFIPTAKKIDYINALMEVKFDVLDCGSFVSARTIPQMADSGEVLDNIDKSLSNTQLSVIVANYRGAEKAMMHEQVDIMGFPFSISETFQQRNTNKGQEEAFADVLKINQLAKDENKSLNVYLSMAFGNPYGENWDIKELDFWTERFYDAGIQNVLISDTTGTATTTQIKQVFTDLLAKFPELNFGAHFHNKYEESYPKLKAAYDAGCRSFDSAIKGIGGCPLATDDLTGNMPTEKVFNFMSLEKIDIRQNLLHFERAYNLAKDIFHF
ncbi:beta/alpha barrel domain-containing protein [Frigoriflavimonas asaccharolytica]|uniref:Hydroxymethylglutaryl-CoA lyase n=1 Tax=Frigoriflavimonas asaccharolytica TaxID=2735899 RepID=A0A8J8K7M9_9FLAO|nr:hydroxymethylglutaryl-CoA lyase [Frigoriflavimonas asaccharolytica]NRS91112.1 hydroxymethylglutaryl-CoA lyase [Frigoriflavimonas asaccharolytica]